MIYNTVDVEAQTQAVLKEALGYLEASDPGEATKVLSPLFEYEFECPPLVFTSACCNFWARRMGNAMKIADSFVRGETLLTDWKEFMADFVANRVAALSHAGQKADCMPAIYASRRGVFAFALQNYEDAMKTGGSAEALRRAALCCKKLGNYEAALDYLAKAREQEDGGAAAGKAADLAETADCYALCGGDRNAKVLFKEAFYVSPDEVDLDMLDSQLIRMLIEKTEELGYKGNLLQRWIPVWGTLWGVFCVKRGINATEAIKLRRDIFSLENELDEKDGAAGGIRMKGTDREVIVPRLLNLYFWYIDYLTMIRGKDAEAEKMINNVLLKIKILDKNVYDIYVR